MLGASHNPNTVAQINRQFHLCIVEAARNQFLTHCYNDLSNALMLLGKTTLDTKQRIDHVYTQHGILLLLCESAMAALLRMR